MSHTPRTLDAAKAQAKALRTALADQGTPVSHSQALELVARQSGARDWNTLHAKLASNLPDPFRAGDRVQGHYLGQAFTGTVISVRPVGTNQRVTMQLDEAVDVVEFDSFSAWRQRVSGTIGPDGASPQKTSNGRPQLTVFHKS